MRGLEQQTFEVRKQAEAVQIPKVTMRHQWEHPALKPKPQTPNLWQKMRNATNLAGHWEAGHHVIDKGWHIVVTTLCVAVSDGVCACVCVFKWQCLEWASVSPHNINRSIGWEVSESRHLKQEGGNCKGFPVLVVNITRNWGVFVYVCVCMC